MNELYLLLSNTIMIRRLKKDVLTQLPPKNRQQVTLIIEDKHRKTLNSIQSEFSNVKKNLWKKSVQSDREKLRELRSDKYRLVLELFSDSGTAKLPSIIEYLKNILESGEFKFLIFAHHKNILDGIQSFLQTRKVDHIRIDGSTMPINRKPLVDHFQTTPECRVAVLSLTAAGTGLNFTAASLVIFTELFWNPGTLKQAEDRAHRIGQENYVDIRYLIGKGTSDELMWKMLKHKLEILGEALNGGDEHNELDVGVEREIDSNSSLVEEFFEKYMEDLSNYQERSSDRKQRMARRKERMSSKRNEDHDDEDGKEEEEEEEEEVETIRPPPKKGKKDKEQEKRPETPRRPIMVEDTFDEDEIVPVSQQQQQAIQKGSWQKLQQFLLKK
eukprot:TRINITY_DN9328_c0_g1_i3.p1 TRINITY_DN9328_c0_g1~~TRINITY_DN9328_c0_g1_i3.p1  ORF type:complete len:386 (-),score=122.09 TRINITY_DN9328_c0_g1_i3:45-1202(-)